MRIPSARRRQELLGAAYEAGIRHFDVARLYGLGRAESELGRFVRSRRDMLTIATKFGIEPSHKWGAVAKVQAPARAMLNKFPALRRAVKRREYAFIAPRKYDRAIAERHLHTSLKELGLAHIDIYFLHGPSPHDIVHADELVEFLNEAQEAGKIGAWGISQDADAELTVFERLGPSAILQIRADVFNPIASLHPRITFGVLGRAHARIAEALTADTALLTRWAYSLDVDPLRENELARLLVADALAANPNGATLFSTTRVARMGVASGALICPPPTDLLDTFRNLCRSLDSRANA